MKKVIKRIHLAKMPFDRWDGENFTHIHATGDLCVFEDGSFELEYEDGLYSDAENCIEEWEEEK